jgi:hypothetical protein
MQRGALAASPAATVRVDSSRNVAERDNLMLGRSKLTQRALALSEEDELAKPPTRTIRARIRLPGSQEVQGRQQHQPQGFRA